MTREEMRYKLNELRMMLNDGKHGEEQGILVEIISELDKLEWIPVSERLPEVGENGLSEWVLVTFKGIDKTVTMYDRICHGEWLTPCFDGEKVLAWQPLPEPYKAESVKGGE